MNTREEEMLDSPDSDAEQGGRRRRSTTPVKKKRARGELSSAEKAQGPKTFQTKWLEMEEFKGWLQAVPGDKLKARCIPCNATFTAGKSDVEKHARGQKHATKVKSIKGVRPIAAVFAAPTKEQKLEKEVKSAEILLAGFFSEHNIAIHIADHLVQLMKKIFHDSEIVKKFTLDRTKCTAVIKNVLAKTEKEEIVEDLKSVPFSVLVDESTDVAGFKNMCLLTKYVSPKTGKVRTPLLEMIKLDSKDCSAEALYGKFKGTLCEKHEVPITNCIGLGVDHAAVMFGKNNSFYTRLKSDSPALVLMDCICHSSHIAATAACKKLPAFVKNTIQRVVSYVSISPKRSAIFEEFVEFYSQEQRKLISLSQTRWLVMHSCVVRLLENLTALEHFFLLCSQEDPRDREAPALYEEMKNPYFKAYLLFLKYALDYFNQMNALFQSSKVLVHRLQAESRQLMTKVCQNYMRENVLESSHKIDVKHPHFQLPLEKVYLGPGTVAALDNVRVPNDPNLNEQQRVQKREQHIKTFRLQCLDFYITAADQLKAYLPLNNDIMREATCIDPEVALSSKARTDQLPELIHFYRQFKDVAHLDEDALAREWRNMPHEILPEMAEKLKVMEPEEFWLEISTLKDYMDVPKFPNLVKVARLAMTLPHSNAEAEGVFAVVTDTKNKKRNRMGEETLDGITVVRVAMRQKKVACYQYEVTENHLKKHNKSMYEK